MLLAGLYLFFVRVLWSVFSELRDPRTVARKRRNGSPAANDATRTTARRSSAPPSSSTPGAAPLGPAAQSGGVAVAEAVAVGQLTVLDPVELAGHRYSLGREITLGRANTNGIILNDTYVSTVHARIFHTNGTYFVEDLASRNGSMLNGQAIVATTALMPGDRLSVGATTMEFA